MTVSELMTCFLQGFVIFLSILGFYIGAIGVLLTPVVCVTVLLLW